MASSKINIDLVLNAKGFRPLGRINGQLGEFEKSLDASNARVLAFGASAGAILAVRKAFTATVKAAIEVEKSLQDINVILQATSANLKKFGSDLFQIASQTGQSFQVAADAAAELARQGLGTEETLKRTRDALILARLSGMGAAEAVNSLTAAINTFNKAGLDSTVIINKLANVDAAFAVSSDDLAKALGRVGSSAQGAGVSLDQLLAIVTTVQQKTARGGAVIGNSFKTIFTRIQRPRVIKELENLGVAVRGVEGEMLPAIKVLSNLAKQFDNLSQSQRSQITELVGGVFQVNILKSAMSDLSKETGIYSRALDISLGSSDQALKRNEELNKTLSAQFQRTVNTFKEGAAELGELTIAPTLEKLFGAVEGMAKLGETDGGKIGGAIAKSIFEGIGNFIAGPGLLIIGFTLFKTFSQLGRFAADAFKTLTGLNKNFQTQLNLQKQIFSVLDENPDLLRKIKDGTVSVEDAHREIYDQISRNTTALEDQLLMSQRLAAGLSGAGAGYSSEFGAFAGTKTGKKPKFGASGYMPNFSEEIAGMIASGYSRSQINNPKVKKQNIHDGRGGSFSATINGHEDVLTGKNSKGKMSTFVVPPKNTDAYKEYMSALSGGFIPNFAKKGLKGRFGVGSVKDIKLSKSNLQAIEDEVRAGTLRKDRVGIPEIDAAVGRGSLVPSKSTSKKEGHTTGKSFVNLKDRLGESGGGLRIFDVKKKFGILGLYGRGTDKGYGEASVNKISEITKKIKEAGLKGKKGPATAKEVLGIDRIGFKNASFRALGGALEDDKQDGWFSKELRKKFAKPMQKLANSFSKRLLGNDATSTTIATSGAPLMSASAEGNVFETIVNALTSQGVGQTRGQAFEAALAADQNQTWDFEESGRPDGLFKKYFDFDPSILKADAKRSINAKSGASMANKIFNTSADDMGQGSAAWLSYVDSMISQAKKSQKSKAAGYIPNFNALYESVRREKEAGVPAGRIRVGQSEKLRNPSNPAGFGIYNTRDEPMGLSQGINNSIAAGIDPKKQGRFNGYIPNYVGPSQESRKIKLEDVAEIQQQLELPFTEGAKKIAQAITDATGPFRNQSPGSPSKGGPSKGKPSRRDARTDPGVKGPKGPKGGLGVGDGTKKNNNPMQAILLLGMVEQGAAALNNTIGENNTVAKSLTSSITSLISTAIMLTFAMRELKDMDWYKGLKGADPSGKGSAIQGLSAKMQGFGKETTKWGRSRSWGKRRRTTAEIMANKSEVGKGFVNRVKFGAGRGIGKLGGGISKLGGGIGKISGGAVGGVMAGAAATASVGRIVGDLFSNSDLDPTFKAAREAGTAFERIKESTEKNIGALNTFKTSVEQAAQVYGDSSATMTQVINASKSVQKHMLKLPAEFRAKMAGIVDPEMVSSMVQQFTEKEQARAASAGQDKFAADTLRESRDYGAAEKLSSPWQSFKNYMTTGEASGRTAEDDKVNQQNIAQVGKDLINNSVLNMGQDKFRDADLNTVFRETAMIDTDDPDARIEKLTKGLNLDPEKDAKAIKRIGDVMREGGDQAEEFLKSLAKNSLQLQADLKTQQAMEPARKAFIAANRAAERAINDQKKALESEQRIRKETIKISSQAAKSFLTSVGSIKLDNINKVNDAVAESTKKFGGAIGQAETALTKTDGAMGTDLTQSTQAMLTKASTFGVGSISQAEADTQAEAIGKRIKELRDTGDEKKISQAEKLEATKIAIENLGGTSERMAKELQEQTREIREQTKAQIAAARQAQRLKSFGGTAALLDPSKLNATYTQIRGGAQAMAASKAAGSVTGFNRGRINQLKAMQDLAGGELPPAMRAEAQRRAEQVALSDARKQNRANNLGFTDEQLKKGAAEKAANLFKGDPQEQNTKALESLTTTLSKGIQFVSAEGQGRLQINRMQNQYALGRGKFAQRNMRMGEMYHQAFSGQAGQQSDAIARMEAYARSGTTWADVRNNAAYGAAAGSVVGAGWGGYAGMGIGGGMGAAAGGVGAVPGAMVGGAVGTGLGWAAGGAVGGAAGGGLTMLSMLGGPTRHSIEARGNMSGPNWEAMIGKLKAGDGVTNNHMNVNFPAGGGAPAVNGIMDPKLARQAAAHMERMAREIEGMKKRQATMDPAAYNKRPPSNYGGAHVRYHAG